MNLYKMMVRLVVFTVLTLTIGVIAMNMKADFLGPKIMSCPNAYFGINSLLSNPASASTSGLIQSVWDCSIGALLYIALPGVGISWFLTKHIT